MKVIAKEVSDLTDQEYKKCRRLNFGKNGEMHDELLKQRFFPLESKKTAKAIMIFDDDLLIGWSLVFPIAKTKGYAAHFYVRHSHRRRGYGTILLQKVANYDEKPIVYPHDRRSGGLLKKNPVRCYISDRIWLR